MLNETAREGCPSFDAYHARITNMLKKRLVVEQLEIVHDLISKRTLSSLRIALILLDNLAEIIMYRKYKEESRFNDSFRSNLSDIPDEQLPQSLFNLKKELLSKNKQKIIEKYHNEKVNFLTNIKQLSPEKGEFLTSVHFYRNLAHHKEEVRADILLSITLLLFEICCDLFIELETLNITWSSDYDENDWQKFFNQYGIKFEDRFEKDTWGIIIRKVKHKLSISVDVLKSSLIEHLQKRFYSTASLVTFVENNSPLQEVEFLDWKEKYEKLERYLKDIKLLEDKISIFNTFTKIERYYEPYEIIVIEKATSLDQWIQMQIDIARGK